MTVAKKCGMIISAENEETLLSADLQKPERFFSQSEYANVAQSVEQLIRKNQVCDSKSEYANVAQSVEQLIRKNQVCDPKSEYANVAQSVEQLIRNQQVVCSSHIISSRKTAEIERFPLFS